MLHRVATVSVHSVNKIENDKNKKKSTTRQRELLAQKAVERQKMEEETAAWYAFGPQPKPL